MRSSASISARERFDLLGDSDPLDTMAVDLVRWWNSLLVMEDYQVASQSRKFVLRSRRVLTCSRTKLTPSPAIVGLDTTYR
jgi:hypothetical protein